MADESIEIFGPGRAIKLVDNNDGTYSLAVSGTVVGGGGGGSISVTAYQNDHTGGNQSADLTVSPASSIALFDVEAYDNGSGEIEFGPIYWPEFRNIVGRNLIINGEFEQWAQALTNSNAYFTNPAHGTRIADCWKIEKNTTAVVDIYPINYSHTTPGDPNVFYALEAKVITPDAALPANGKYTISQPIEGYVARSILGGNFLGGARTWSTNVIVSFMVKSSLPGIFSVALTSATNQKGMAGVYEIAIGEEDTWVRKTVALRSPEPYQFDMDFESGIALVLHFVLAAGSDFSASTPFWADGPVLSGLSFENHILAADSTFAITAVKLELGDSFRTPYQSEGPDATIRMCQRYFYSSYWGWNGAGQAVSSGEAYFIAASTSKLVGAFRFPAEMRDIPTVKIFASDGTEDAVTSVAGSTIGSAALPGRVSRQGFCEINDAGAPYTVGQAYRFMISADASL
jgi:hypothetical protein